MARRHGESQLQYVKRLRKEYKEAESALLDADTTEEVEEAQEQLEEVEESLEEAETDAELGTTTDDLTPDDPTDSTKAETGVANTDGVANREGNSEDENATPPTTPPTEKTAETQRAPQPTHLFERRIGRRK